MGVNRGIYHDGWMASSLSFVPWQSVRGAFDPDKAKWGTAAMAVWPGRAHAGAGQLRQRLHVLAGSSGVQRFEPSWVAFLD